MVLDELSRSIANDPGASLSVTPAYRARFIALGRQLAARIAKEAGQPARWTFLLFERWRDNALAAEFEKRYPQHAAQRRSVPDDFYKGREDDAPCIVALPPEIWQHVECATLADAFTQEWWAAWLEQVWRQAHKRLERQDFAAVLISRAGALTLARNFAYLGNQRPPGATQKRLFRYQDPRVMQRVWPALSAMQRTLWLDPVLAWWAPMHPWGPWEPQLFGQDALPDDLEPQWFQAEKPAPESIGDDREIYRGALFDARQWALAHSAPVGNQIWRNCALDGLGAAEQPDAKSMDRLIAEGQALGLSEENLQNYVRYGWLGRWTDPATGELCSAWQSPQGAQALRRALDTLAQQPQARLATLLHEAGALPRRQTSPAPIPARENPQGPAHGR